MIVQSSLVSCVLFLFLMMYILEYSLDIINNLIQYMYLPHYCFYCGISWMQYGTDADTSVRTHILYIVALFLYDSSSSQTRVVQ